MSTTVPNYVGTSSEVQGSNNVEAVGANVHAKLAPKNVHYDKPAPLPSMFVTPAPKNRFEVTQEADDHAKTFRVAQDALFDIWPENVDKAMSTSTMLQRPTMPDLEPSDPFDEYADTMLKHNALFQIKIMRGPP